MSNENILDYDYKKSLAFNKMQSIAHRLVSDCPKLMNTTKIFKDVTSNSLRQQQESLLSEIYQKTHNDFKYLNEGIGLSSKIEQLKKAVHDQTLRKLQLENQKESQVNQFVNSELDYHIKIYDLKEEIE